MCQHRHIAGEDRHGGAVRRHPWNTGLRWSRVDAEPRRLTPDRRAHFDQHGWLVVESLIAARGERLGDAEADHEEVESRLRSLPDERVVIPGAGSITVHPHLATRSNAARRTGTARPSTGCRPHDDPDRQYPVLAGGCAVT